LQDVDVEEKVDVIISEWMGYMLLYEVLLAMSSCEFFALQLICYHFFSSKLFTI
jgi:hypothetical protein